MINEHHSIRYKYQNLLKNFIHILINSNLRQLNQQFPVEKVFLVQIRDKN